MTTVQGFYIDRKIAAVLNAAKLKKETRYATDLVRVSESGIAATDGKHLIEVTFPHTIPPGLYRLEKDILLPQQDGDGRRFPEPETYWPQYKAFLCQRYPVSVSRTFLVTAISRENFLDPWAFEKTLKAIDKLELENLEIGLDSPFDRPVELRASKREISIRGLFMPYEYEGVTVKKVDDAE